MAAPAVNPIVGRIFTLVAIAVFAMALWAFVGSVVDWRAGACVSRVLSSGAVLALGLGIVVEIPDYLRPLVPPTRGQRALRIGLGVVTVVLLAAAVWIRSNA